MRRATPVRVAARVAAGAAALAVAVAAPAPAPAAPAPAAPTVDTRALRGHGTLAFVSLGRLYVLSGATGRLRRSSAAGEEAYAPAYSPRGRWLAYSTRPTAGSGGGTPALFVARADGADRHRVPGASEGSWLPDGELLAGGTVWRVAVDGSVVRAAAAPVGLVAWAPDASAFAFVTSTLAPTHTRPSSGVEQLQLAASLTGRRTVWYTAHVAFTPKEGFRGDFVTAVTVRPRGQGVLFTLDPLGSASIAADGLALEFLAGPGARPVRLGLTVDDAVTVASSGAVAFVDGPSRYAWTTKHLETCAGVGGACAAVVEPRGQLTFDPAWSPGGRSLAYVAAPPGRSPSFYQAELVRWYASHTLWLLRGRARTPRRVAGARGASAPTWSADGRSVVYAAGDALWLAGTGGGAPVRIAGPLLPPASWPNYYGQVAWRLQFAWAS